MISTTEWVITIAVLAAIILFDLTLAIIRRNKETTFAEAATWTGIYVGAAIAFGIFLPQWTSPEIGTQYFAGWLTEYALSIDNIFVFIILLTSLKIKKEAQQLVLLIHSLAT